MKQFHSLWQQVLAFALVLLWHVSISADELLIDDFESGSYQRWEVSGTAFGDAPANGTRPGQNPVSGFRGHRLVNSFGGGDASVGQATSAAFEIKRPYLVMLIGGGAESSTVGVELLVEGQSVRRQAGRNSEVLEWATWDVSEFAGRSARVRIYDQATDGWGHICVDHLVQTDTPADVRELEKQLASYRASDQYMNEPLRPQFHYSPEIHWMNDPNGLFYLAGAYHLFHQYNPLGNSWGHMSWGHASGSDLVHWKHLPLAIREQNGVMAFSGCCVVDHENRSGFGTKGHPPIIAIYTGHGHGKQVQNLAYSRDNGTTWTPYAENPVLDLDQTDFRDPKVFWHDESQRWVMVVSLARQKQLVFYASKNLKQWSELSRFGPAGTQNKLNWECPDLFELPVEGTSDEKLWVLEVDMGNGSIAGGSGGEYFVGHFDGTQFTAIQEARWVDYGRDFYAPISWDNIPEQDGRRIWIGWFNNWETCLVPTHPWRSCLSVPRTLSLRRINDAASENPIHVLVQQPVGELLQLRSQPRALDGSRVTWPPVRVTAPGELNDLAFDLETQLRPGTARSIGMRIHTGEDEYIEVGYDREIPGVYVDRSQSGNVDFHPAFAGRHDAPARVIDGVVSLRLLVDRSTIEVFINGGEAVISDRFFPTSHQPWVECFAGDDSASFLSAELYELSSVWRAE